jgi:hypothetical protein
MGSWSFEIGLLSSCTTLKTGLGHVDEASASFVLLYLMSRKCIMNALLIHIFLAGSIGHISVSGAV